MLLPARAQNDNSHNETNYPTRTTHAHDALRCTAPVRMCALRMWVGHVEQMSEISRSSRTTMIELNMESGHNLYLACEDSSQRAFFFWTFSCSLLALLASTVYWLRCFLFKFSTSPTVGCVQYSTPQNVYIAEDQPCCPTHPSLSRSAVLPCPPSLG